MMEVTGDGGIEGCVTQYTYHVICDGDLQTALLQELGKAKRFTCKGLACLGWLAS